MTTRSGFTSAAREVVDIVVHFAFYILRHMTALFSFWRRDLGTCFAQESHGDNDEQLHSMVGDNFSRKALTTTEACVIAFSIWRLSVVQQSPDQKSQVPEAIFCRLERMHYHYIADQMSVTAGLFIVITS